MFVTLHPRSQGGDTIVEVLIAIAVITTVLAGAYISTQRSLLATRGAQERSNALKLGQAQLEQLKGIIASNPDAVFGAGIPSPFCINGTVLVAASNAACAVDTSGVPTTIEPVFKLSMVRVANAFTLTETWADVGGKRTDTLQLKYRAYQ